MSVSIMTLSVVAQPFGGINFVLTMMPPGFASVLLVFIAFSACHAEDGVPKFPMKLENVLPIEAPRANYSAMFWHIHKSGGTTVKNFASVCLNLTLASEVGIREGHINDQVTVLVPNCCLTAPTQLFGSQELKAVQFGLDGPLFVNVDTSTIEGMDRAQRMGFQQKPLADVVVTPLLIPAVEKLFSPQHRALFFTIMRHPVDRAISQFYYLQKATWEPTYNPKTANMTLMEFIENEPLEINWMTRQLSGKMLGDIYEQDFDAAKDILKNYCWIGIVTHMEETIRRFGQLLGWNRDKAKWNYCVDWLGKNTANSHKHQRFHPNSPEWKKLEEINAWDVELFEYAVYQFRKQGARHFPQIALEMASS